MSALISYLVILLLYKIFYNFIFNYSNVFRYQAVLLRARFDENAKITDMSKAAELLKQGEEELFLTQHPIPKKCK
jgi:hypothetical protein